MDELRFISPMEGDVLVDQADGDIKDGLLMLPVSVCAQANGLLINGIRAQKNDQGLFEANVPVKHGLNQIEAVDPDSGNRQDILVFRLKNAHRTYRFTVDDGIRCFEDLTRHPEKYPSLFDHPFLAIFKKAHRLYGSMVHINVFYASPDGSFNLSMMTDRYREEFRQNASWLSLTFHARGEFPDALYQQASGEEIVRDFEQVHREIIRFAGPEVLRDSTTLHWGACNEEGSRALRSCGFRTLCGYLRLRQDGQTSVSYHLSPELVQRVQRREGWYDRENDLLFLKLDLVLNEAGWAADQVYPGLDELKKRPQEGAMIQMVIHEQYFYPDYVGYEPDYAERILNMARWMQENGYRCISLNEAVV